MGADMLRVRARARGSRISNPALAFRVAIGKRPTFRPKRKEGEQAEVKNEPHLSRLVRRTNRWNYSSAGAARTCGLAALTVVIPKAAYFLSDAAMYLSTCSIACLTSFSASLAAPASFLSLVMFSNSVRAFFR